MLVHQCYRGRKDAAHRVNSFGEVIPRLVLGENVRLGVEIQRKERVSCLDIF